MKKRIYFDISEVRKYNEICRFCDYGLLDNYCRKFNTDSIVFKYNKCERLNHDLH